jgi:hypothetical protein
VGNSILVELLVSFQDFSSKYRTGNTRELELLMTVITAILRETPIQSSNLMGDALSHRRNTQSQAEYSEL